MSALTAIPFITSGASPSSVCEVIGLAICVGLAAVVAAVVIVVMIDGVVYASDRIASAQKKIKPVFYVQHPDGSYTQANPQPKAK